MDKKIPLTGPAGRPLQDDNNSITTAGFAGYTLMHDHYFHEKLGHFARERIPERVVHAKGSGAHGIFEVTDDISKYCRADFLSEIGKKTELFMRFSTVGGESGSADSARDPRGFAIKLYTEEGNYDIVGNNTPVFFIRDPIKFPDFIHTQKRHPHTGLKDPNMFWDFLSLTPESNHQVTILFTDRGTPRSFRNMDGFGTNTFMFYNENGECFWAKWHFKTNQGNETWTGEEAARLAGTSPDSNREDLFKAIAEGKYPSWTAYVQIMTMDESEKYRFDPFDATKVWFHADYPLIRVGKITLSRNPENFFEEVEQVAFSPGNMVPGVYPSPDRMLNGRIMSYKDAQRYRLGANFEQLTINSPKNEIFTNFRDGIMTINNYGASENYYPNSFNMHAPEGVPEAPLMYLRESMIGRHPFELADIDFVQAGELYRRVLTDEGRANLITNIVTHMANVRQKIQYRQCALFFKCHPEYGERVARGLNLDIGNVERLAGMSQEKRVEATA